MPLNNYDPEGKLVGAVLGHEDCPKCGTLMETVEVEDGAGERRRSAFAIAGVAIFVCRAALTIVLALGAIAMITVLAQ